MMLDTMSDMKTEKCEWISEEHRQAMVQMYRDQYKLRGYTPETVYCNEVIYLGSGIYLYPDGTMVEEKPDA